jgi:uncharacterized coiled-coil protein SlyX
VTCAQHEAELSASQERVRELETTVSQHEAASDALRARLTEERATNARLASRLVETERVYEINGELTQENTRLTSELVRRDAAWRTALRMSHLTATAMECDLMDSTNAPPQHKDCALLRALWDGAATADKNTNRQPTRGEDKGARP